MHKHLMIIPLQSLLCYNDDYTGTTATVLSQWIRQVIIIIIWNDSVMTLSMTKLSDKLFQQRRFQFTAASMPTSLLKLAASTGTLQILLMYLTFCFTLSKRTSLEGQYRLTSFYYFLV